MSDPTIAPSLVPSIMTALAAPPNPFDYAATTKAVHASLEAAFAAVPPGKRAVLLGKIVETPTGPQAQAVVAAHINGTWEFAAGGAWDGKSHPTGEVELMGAW